MVHRVACSDMYKASPQEVREMPFRDFVIAHVLLDHADAVREELSHDG